MKEIIGGTKGVVFLGTPHQGSEIADFQNLLTWIVKASRILEENVLVQELSSRQTTRNLVRLNNWYKENAKNKEIETEAFYETEKTNIPGLGQKLIVNIQSSNPNILGLDPTAVTGADHLSLSKPKNKENSTVYIGVKEFIDDYLPTHHPSDKKTSISEKDSVEVGKKS